MLYKFLLLIVLGSVLNPTFCAQGDRICNRRMVRPLIKAAVIKIPYKPTPPPSSPIMTRAKLLQQSPLSPYNPKNDMLLRACDACLLFCCGGSQDPDSREAPL